MDQTIGLVLAGGVGSRLGVLASARAKPAVPFGGIYRIIDFTLSNAINSGVNRVGVLTQYKPSSLMAHIQNGEAWGFVGRTKLIKILPPSTGREDSDWYRGTADAVRQNMHFIRQQSHCDTVLILSGDHIYNMDYSEMVAFHRERDADLTIATRVIPFETASEFGIAEVDDEQRIVGWQEKPETPKSNLASMGVYVFSMDYLEKIFRDYSGVDFGKEFVPLALHSANTYAYPFHGFWRDVGTLNAYWQTNMDLLNPAVGLDPEKWHTYTTVNDSVRIGDRPPSYLGSSSSVRNSLISPGCIIEGTVDNSILSPGVWVQKGATVRSSVIMNDCEIGEKATIDRVIMDKNVEIGVAAYVGEGKTFCKNEAFPNLLQDGLTVIGKGVSVPDQVVVGRHCIIDIGVKTSMWEKSKLDCGGYIMGKPVN